MDKFKSIKMKKTNWQDITDFAKACIALGTTEEDFNKKNFEELGMSADTIAYEKLKIVAKAINAGWVPDMMDFNQWKHYPWFRIARAGLVCVDSFTAASYTYAYVGSRLCFSTEEKAEHAGKYFADIYSKYLL